MANTEWDELKQALRKPATPEAMRAASEAFKKVKLGKGSKPTLVSLGKKQGYPNAVPVDKIPDELAKNPEFFKLMGRIVK